MKNKKTIGIIVGIVLAITLVIGIIFVFTAEDGDTSLNLIERQWIETNKNNLIDFSVISDVPILSNNGDGLIISFFDSLKTETELSFNMISYRTGTEAKTSYSVKLVDNVVDNQVLIYEDNYAIISTEAKKYTNASELTGLTIGVLNESIEEVSNCLYNADVTYKTYNSEEELLAGIAEVDGIVLLKTTNLNTIVENDYTISYNIDDYTKSYVMQLGDEERLNEILKKYYNVWSSNNYETEFGKSFFSNYVELNDIKDSTSVNFRSKRYVYGYLENAPYDTLFDGELAGINNQVLSSFTEITEAEISYKPYSSIEELVNDFNENKVDFYYNMGQDTTYNMDVVDTVSVYDNKVAILGRIDSLTTYSTIKSLKDASVIKNSYIHSFSEEMGVSTKQYDNIEQLIGEEDNYIIMDLSNYNYYKTSLENYVLVDVIDTENYSYTIRDITENEMFIDLLNLYISFVSSSDAVNLGLEELLNVNVIPYILKNVAIILGSIVGVLLIIVLVLKLRPKNKTSFSKEDKIKYTDALTSLKNRNYLNDSIDKWDNSEVYPQAIVVADLKNIAYINDNYGHAEGDLVIKQAASILIMNQLENSEIIRTSGNEFLVYMVGYTEKQVITHIRKLNKELKDLKHGFGCAIGYSIISDAIKTIDDAINEASLDMRNNKEDLSE